MTIKVAEEDLETLRRLRTEALRKASEARMADASYHHAVDLAMLAAGHVDGALCMECGCVNPAGAVCECKS